MNPYAILSGVLLLIAVAFGGYHKGHQIGSAEIQTKWDASKLAQSEANNQAIQAAVAKIDAAQKLDIKQTQKVIANYETDIKTKDAAITAARRDADRERLRITVDKSSVCARPPEAAETAGTIAVNGSREAATIDLPPEIEKGLRDIAEDADRQIADRDAKLAGLRAWVRSHGFYGPESVQ